MIIINNVRNCIMQEGIRYCEKIDIVASDVWFIIIYIYLFFVYIILPIFIKSLVSQIVYEQLDKKGILYFIDEYITWIFYLINPLILALYLINK